MQFPKRDENGVFVFVLVAESFVVSWCSFAITGGGTRVSSVENAPSAF